MKVETHARKTESAEYAKKNPSLIGGKHNNSPNSWDIGAVQGRLLLQMRQSIGTEKVVDDSAQTSQGVVLLYWTRQSAIAT